MSVWGGIQGTQCDCRFQRTMFWKGFFSLWVPRIKSRQAGLCSNLFYPLSHLVSFRSYIVCSSLDKIVIHLFHNLLWLLWYLSSDSLVVECCPSCLIAIICSCFLHMPHSFQWMVPTRFKMVILTSRTLLLFCPALLLDKSCL